MLKLSLVTGSLSVVVALFCFSCHRINSNVMQRQKVEQYFATINDAIAAMTNSGIRLEDANQRLGSSVSLLEHKLQREYSLSYKTELISWVPSNVVYEVRYAGPDGVFGTADDQVTTWDAHHPRPGMRF
jgi:hypothetical protein